MSYSVEVYFDLDLLFIDSGEVDEGFEATGAAGAGVEALGDHIIDIDEVSIFESGGEFGEVPGGEDFDGDAVGLLPILIAMGALLGGLSEVC